MDGEREIGVGPWPGGRSAWPTDDRYDAELLEHGDTRNVVDEYRYWTMDAIVADLDTRRRGFHVAIENWQHDMNIGSIVRTANAFLAAEVHIVGNRRWNRRGRDGDRRYQHIREHPDVASFVEWAREHDLPIVAVDNVDGSVDVSDGRHPESLRSAVRAGGSRAHARGARRRRPRRRDRAGRLDAVDQRGRGSRDRHARMGQEAHLTVRLRVPSRVAWRFTGVRSGWERTRFVVGVSMIRALGVSRGVDADEGLPWRVAYDLRWDRGWRFRAATVRADGTVRRLSRDGQRGWIRRLA